MDHANTFTSALKRLTSELKAAYRLRKKKSYLQTVGWFRSVATGMPVDRESNPLPWLTYPAIAFLQDRIRKEMSVFEYGSGNSTIWWSSRVSSVVSCEHDRKWYERLAPQLPANVEYLHFDLVPGGDYSKAIGRYHEVFDIVVIDGRDRVNCAHNSFTALKPDGVIVWDNSDLDKYQPGYDDHLAKGFKRLDFWGPGPIGTSGWCTSVFYRPGNCLGI